MLLDSKLSFVPLGSPLSLVAAVGVDIVSPNVIDLLGGGAGTLVTNITGISAAPGQADAMGTPTERPELVVAIGTGLVNDTGTPTLRVELQGAPDNGSGSPGTYVTLGSSGAILAAQGTAGTIIARLPWLPPFPLNLRPRFLRLNFEIPAGTNFSAGTILYALVTTVRDDWFIAQQPRNYKVSGVA
jgi:hypothetical protein